MRTYFGIFWTCFLKSMTSPREWLRAVVIWISCLAVARWLGFAIEWQMFVLIWWGVVVIDCTRFLSDQGT